jgi:o-succinylbenzoate synthase
MAVYLYEKLLLNAIGKDHIMYKLQLERIELRELEMPLKTPFETSFGITTGRRVLIVRVFDKSGASGYGECTAMARPFFNHETVDAAWSIITGFVGPILSLARVSEANEVSGALTAIQGNRMAIGAVETAIWDLEAKILDKQLWRHLGGTLEKITCGVSIGLQSSPDVLLEKVAREVDSGYQRIKIKIKPGQDVELVKAVRQNFPEIVLSVDANSAYCLDKDLGILRELDDYDLLMIEQPLGAGDLVDHAKLQQQLKTPICLDESITSLRDAKHALELGSCKIINIKLGRVGGHASARAIQELARTQNIPVWCGGMLETGIGRAHNIAMSTHKGFTLPGDISASARYWEDDIIDPPVTVSDQGTINVPSSPGIGFAVNEQAIKKITTRTEMMDL